MVRQTVVTKSCLPVSVIVLGPSEQAQSMYQPSSHDQIGVVRVVIVEIEDHDAGGLITYVDIGAAVCRGVELQRLFGSHDLVRVFSDIVAVAGSVPIKGRASADEIVDPADLPSKYIKRKSLLCGIMPG